MSAPARSGAFRIAVRRFDAFERAIAAQWDAFTRHGGGAGLALEAVPLDLHDLHAAVIAPGPSAAAPWDAAFVVTDWLAEAHALGRLADLAPALERHGPAGYPEAWSPSLLRLQRFGDAVLGLPYHDGPECMIYRRDLLEDERERDAFARAHGRDLAPPATWDEFHELARFFHRPERGLAGTAFAGFPDGHNAVYDYCLQVWSRGGEIVDAQGLLQLDTAPSRDGLTWYRRMRADAGATHHESARMDSVASGMAFSRGEVALMVNWFGFAAMCEASRSPVAGRIGIAPVPRAGGGAPLSLNLYWLLAIPSASRHPAIAMDFLRHCAGPAMDRLLTLAGGIGCRRSTWLDPAIQRLLPFAGALEPLHAQARELPRLRAWSGFAARIDALVQAVTTSDQPIAALTAQAQLALEREHALSRSAAATHG